MCILLVTKTKKHSIILSNRDEYLARPTIRATWWPAPHDNVLSGRDLARPSHGTWLGMTRQGRIAALTNYREESEQGATAAAVSRGEITKEFLLSEKDVDEWIQEVLESGVYTTVGGFSLLCGNFKKIKKGYAVVSNRSCLESGGADYVLDKDGCECAGLSNSLLHNEWPKVKMGKELLKRLKEENIQDEEKFIEKCFELLSYAAREKLYLFRTNSFTEPPTMSTLCNSIFIPRFVAPALPSIPGDHTKADSEWLATDHPRPYGTREQTVILVSHDDGRVVFTERTLWDENMQPVNKKDGEIREEFQIEGWNDGK